jgi:SAM-dependent methyltransferase
MERKNSCLACGNTKDNSFYTASEKMHGLGGKFEYMSCGACKSLQLVHIPEDLSPYYPVDYYAFGKLVPSSGLKNLFKRWRKKLFDLQLWKFGSPEYLDWIAPLDLHENDRIADIGCGNGQLVYELKCSGFKNLFGFDPYLPEEMTMAGLELKKRNVFGISGQYDVIMLHHSFEHMENPIEVMDKLNSLLKKGGKLLIRVPVTDAEVWEQEKTDWFQLDAPRHFFIPSKKSMEILAEKCGFKLEEIIFDSNEFQFIITDMYKNGLTLTGNNHEKWVDQKTRKSLQQKAKILNQSHKGDQACFYFEKT